MGAVFENWTPHDVVYHFDNGNKRVFLRENGKGVRIAESVEEAVTDDDGITSVLVRRGPPENLPARRPGVVLIVSGVVREACLERKDLYSPIDFVRDPQGRIVGCRAFVRNY